MKTIFCIFNLGLLLTFISCGHICNSEKNTDKLNQVTNSNYQNTYDTIKNSESIQLDYIIFGIFCGECGGECATMYKLDIVNDKFFVDHTDSYWEYKHGKPFQFATSINDKSKQSIARQILDSIPIVILDATKPTQKFGCPDCTDGCVIYFEIKKASTIKQFYIDNQTGKLTGEIKLFAEHLKRIIDKL